MAQHISYPTVKVDGLSIFYREAGLKDAPTILLLHGLPSSSRMFEPLLMAGIGLVIGAIVLLMYMPIFELAGNLQ